MFRKIDKLEAKCTKVPMIETHCSVNETVEKQSKFMTQTNTATLTYVQIDVFDNPFG
jgi:hypothetical protein